MFRTAAFLSPACAALLLAGCGGNARNDAPAPPPEDAAILDALADPLMTDPELASQNQADAAIAVSGPVGAALPPIDRGPEAIDAARDAAAALAGKALPPVPEPTAASLADLREALTAAQMALAAKVPGSGCARRAEYSARWAALLPDALQVYPRGAVEEAAGIDAPGCRLRVVHFRTPVPLAEVLGFYHARLRAGGYTAAHEAEGAEHALRGRKGAADYVIYLRKGAEGLTAADIVIGGG